MVPHPLIAQEQNRYLGQTPTKEVLAIDRAIAIRRTQKLKKLSRNLKRKIYR